MAGRPPKTDQVVAVVDGQLVRATERILQVLRLGAYFEQACAAAGVSKFTAYGWLRTGADSVARRHRNPDVALTAHEEQCMAFSNAVALAEAEWEALALGTLEQLARGGITQEVITVETMRGEKGETIEVKRSSRKSVTLPDARVLMWRLERRFPERYGHRVDVTSGGEAFGQGGEDRAGELAAQALEHLENVTSIDAAPSSAKPARKAKPKAAVSPPARRRKA